MQRAMFIAVGLTSAIAACHTHERVVERPVVTRETVVEKPTIVERPATVIERPAVIGSTAPSCTYASQSYSHGALSCQDHAEFRCNGGNWERSSAARC
jgi:hypothetical protein